MTGTIELTGGNLTKYHIGDEVLITLRATIEQLTVDLVPIPSPSRPDATAPGRTSARLIGYVTDLRGTHVNA